MQFLKKLFPPKKLNIQTEGTYEQTYSLSIVVTSIAKALKKHLNANIKIDPTHYHKEYMHQLTDIPADILELVNTPMQKVDITIRNIYPPHTDAMRGTYKLFGPYGWEESKFPQQYVQNFNNNLTAVLAMSEYVKDILIQNGVNIPIFTTGLVVEDILDQTPEPFEFDLPKGYRLLHISSAFPRKGIKELLQAYEELSEDFTLILKTFPNPHNTTTQDLIQRGYSVIKKHKKDITLYAKKNKTILHINCFIPKSQIRYLYENSNLLVAPSYGEGFGLPLAEAMLCDLPVLTTAYGGQSDFCTPDTSWLCDFDFAPSNSHFNLKDSICQIPKVDHLIQNIKSIASLSTSQLQQKTKAAKSLIQNKYSSKEVALKIQSAFKHIQK